MFYSIDRKMVDKKRLQLKFEFVNTYLNIRAGADYKRISDEQDIRIILIRFRDWRDTPKNRRNANDSCNSI